MDEREEKTKKAIKGKLAEYIGVDFEDIKDEDIFAEDLHMSPAEFSDFLGSLTELGIDPTNLDLTTTSTVEELIEAVSAHIVE